MGDPRKQLRNEHSNMTAPWVCHKLVKAVHGRPRGLDYLFMEIRYYADLREHMGHENKIDSSGTTITMQQYKMSVCGFEGACTNPKICSRISLVPTASQVYLQFKRLEKSFAGLAETGTISTGWY